MNIERIVLEPGIHIVKPAGSITLGRECQQVEWALNDLVEAGARKVVIDLSEVPYLDSAGLGMLISSTGTIRKAGGEVRLAGVVDRVRGIFRMTGVDTVLATDATTADSVRALGSSGAGAAQA